MNEKQIRRAQNAKKAAQSDLVEADVQANKDAGCSNAGPFHKRMARRLRRAAKRRMSKADRRQGKIICNLDDWEE
jgi:hypothetical protein